MGYYMRFVSTDARPVVPAELRDALAAVSPAYNVEIDDFAATISYDGDVIAHVEINVPGDGLFDQERAELIEFRQCRRWRRSCEDTRSRHPADRDRHCGSPSPLWHRTYRDNASATRSTLGLAVWQPYRSPSSR